MDGWANGLKERIKRVGFELFLGRAVNMMFSDREDAARRLAEALVQYRGQNPLVLAIPHGAVPMAKIIADELGGEVDLRVSINIFSSPVTPVSLPARPASHHYASTSEQFGTPRFSHSQTTRHCINSCYAAS